METFLFGACIYVGDGEFEQMRMLELLERDCHLRPNAGGACSRLDGALHEIRAGLVDAKLTGLAGPCLHALSPRLRLSTGPQAGASAQVSPQPPARKPARAQRGANGRQCWLPQANPPSPPSGLLGGLAGPAQRAGSLKRLARRHGFLLLVPL